MASLAFDTHAFVKELTAVGFSEAQAEAVTSAVRRTREVELAELATKVDLAAVRAEMATKSDVAAIRAEMATKADLAEAKYDILKWVMGAVGFQTVVIVGAVAALEKLLH